MWGNPQDHGGLVNGNNPKTSAKFTELVGEEGQADKAPSANYRPRGLMSLCCFGVKNQPDSEAGAL